MPRVIGVDDWAWRKGCNYGTIVVDLERRKVIDLLPDREAETLTNWLWEHQTVEVVARDRSVTYRNAIVMGQPDAVQVADRWHLLKNLSDLLQSLIDRLQRKKKRASRHLVETSQKGGTIKPEFELTGWQWQEKFQETVAEWKRHHLLVRLLPHLPLKAKAKITSQQNACLNRRAFTHGSSDQSSIPIKLDSRTLVRLCFRKAELKKEERDLIIDARACWEEFDRAYPLIEEFIKIIRGQSKWKLSLWIVRANETGIKELKSFANGLQKDFFAVKEAVTSQWSNGQTEGQVNRLKFIKRSMYGRAKFDLLRARVLHRV